MDANVLQSLIFVVFYATPQFQLAYLHRSIIDLLIGIPSQSIPNAYYLIINLIALQIQCSNQYLKINSIHGLYPRV